LRFDSVVPRLREGGYANFRRFDASLNLKSWTLTTYNFCDGRLLVCAKKCKNLFVIKIPETSIWHIEGGLTRGLVSIGANSSWTTLLS
jgi:hypothetical protein